VRVVVTGASGFVGRATVAALLARKHDVRALVRDAARMPASAGPGRLDTVEYNLKGDRPLGPLLRDADAVIHLATTMEGDDFATLGGSVLGTERLLAAMAEAGCDRLLLCSSFSVYDWARVRSPVGEESPLAENPHRYGAYAAAKVWQERLARRAEARGLRLTVARPGFVWGAGNDDLACIGQRVGGVQLVFGPLRRLPLVHVDNCADWFAHALESPRSVGETFNLVDGDDVTAWRYAGELLRGTGLAARRVALPYHGVRAGVEAAYRASRALYGETAKLPSMFVPPRFVTRFAPFRYRTTKLREVLGWRPPLGFEACVARTWPRRTG
jgi:UDP-glucose 4-epimerase